MNPMADALTTPSTVDDFIRRWEASGAAERPNYALFLSELCDLLGVPHPDPTRPDDAENAYVRTDSSSWSFFRQLIVQFLAPRSDSSSFRSVAEAVAIRDIRAFVRARLCGGCVRE
jgi:hypothetical protein